MNKNDLRVQMPLWNIVLYLILMIWTYSAVYLVDMSMNNFEEVLIEEGETIVIKLSAVALWSFGIGTVFLILFFIAYFIKLGSYNKQNPNHKMPAFSFSPYKSLEVDEMLTQVTQIATKKVDNFYLNILPLVIVLMVFPIHRYIFIVVIFLLLISRDALYYREIRHYITESKVAKREKKLSLTGNKVKMPVLILTIGSIFTVTIVILFTMNANHKENLREMAECADQETGFTVVVEKNFLTSQTKVTCD